MKKMLGLMIAGFMIMAAVGGATWATFSDVETSTGNTISAGTLDLNVNGGNSAVTTFSESDLKPGDFGSGNTVLVNVGSLTGTISVGTSEVSGTAGDNNGDPQISPSNSLYTTAQLGMYLDVGSGWGSGAIGLESHGDIYNYAAAGANNGALGTATVVDGVITGIIPNPLALGTGYQNSVTGDVVSITDSTGRGAIATVSIVNHEISTFTIIRGGANYTANPTVRVLEYHTVQYDHMNVYSSQTWDSLKTMAHDESVTFRTAWSIPSGAGNEIQGGTATVDFTFTLNQ